MAKYAAEVICVKCGKGFTPQKGKPIMLCESCITRMAKPNTTAEAYKTSTAKARANARDGFPWGSRGLSEQERGENERPN